MKHLIAIMISLFVGYAGVVLAQPNSTQGAAPTPAPVALTDGVVRKVDKNGQRITIRHAEIKSMDMPPMTMVFRVKDPALLAKLKPGDRIRFAAESIGGLLTVTNVVPAN